MIKIFFKNFFFIIKKIIKYFYFNIKNIKNLCENIKYKNLNNFRYKNWIKKYEKIDYKKIEKFNYNPLISIIIPVYNVEICWFKKCIDSILKQIYKNFEICIVDDYSKNFFLIKKLIFEYKKKYKNIKFFFNKKHLHISKTTNIALNIAKGEFVTFVDNDDEISKNALYEVIKVLNLNMELDFIYSDEDKIDIFNNRFEPAFKPDWSPDLLMSTNYISHLSIYRKKKLEKIGFLREGFEGAQDYDLNLRFTEIINNNNIMHIPKILYHWRTLSTSTAMNINVKNYINYSSLKALKSAIYRRKINAKIVKGKAIGIYNIYYEIKKEKLVSIIILTKSNYKNMKCCLESLYFKTFYKKIEIIIIDNGKADRKIKDLYKTYKKKIKMKIYFFKKKFNFSKFNNFAVKKSNGYYLLFLNDDIDVINKKWLNLMISFCQFNRIGCVGAKLFYSNMTIQHAGVILGLGGVAGHCHYKLKDGNLGYFGRLYMNVNYLAVTAACLLVKKSDFYLVNGFDERLAFSFNDVDFCLKVFNMNKYNVWLHEVKLFHFESKTRGYNNSNIFNKLNFIKEKKILYNKWKNFIYADPFYNINFSKKYSNFLCK